MSDPDPRALSNLKKKRGVVKGSLTRVSLLVLILLNQSNVHPTRKKFDALPHEFLIEEFRTHHYSIIELVDDESDLERQQEIHDDDVAQLTAHLEELVVVCSSKTPVSIKLLVLSA